MTFELPYGESWQVLRGARDRVGDETPLAVVATLERCAYWQNAPVEPGGAYPATARDQASLTGTLAVPKGSDVRSTDHVRRVSTGQRYQVLGPPQWDGVHPMTGWDPGYVTVTIKAVV
ncbi:hypothetical protein IU469_22255 [Nocardia puris]|uniref:hypothetical protein n=1 Tax=Nocardia puris TaxID=208602 RepID=UPI0018940A49|nr:hypothetical protein [Nocardia puris]MBF6368423.1 hypothetical protein [Nocardia puris]